MTSLTINKVHLLLHLSIQKLMLIFNVCNILLDSEGYFATPFTE